MIRFCRFLVLFALTAGQVSAQQTSRRIPDEYETTGVVGMAINNMGSAGADSHSAMRVNPALIALDRQYSLSAGYHWPTVGREYYQASVVDSKTAKIAAGVSYTGYPDDYLYPSDPKTRRDAQFDSPLARRGVIGIAQNIGSMSLGAGATYVETSPLMSSVEKRQGQERVRGFGINAGGTFSLNPAIRVGASVENLSNRRIDDYVPMTYRAGLAYTASPALNLLLDYRQRKRIVEFEGERLRLDDVTDPGFSDPEQMIFASFIGQLQSALRIMGSYGYALSDDKRRALSGGIAIVNQTISLSYSVSRPYLANSETHQAVALAIDMSM